MAKYVYLATFFSNTGKFDEFKDTVRVNEILHRLQERKASVISINPALGGAGATGVGAVYVITYEAEAPVEI